MIYESEIWINYPSFPQITNDEYVNSIIRK